MCLKYSSQVWKRHVLKFRLIHIFIMWKECELLNNVPGSKEVAKPHVTFHFHNRSFSDVITRPLHLKRTCIIGMENYFKNDIFIISKHSITSWYLMCVFPVSHPLLARSVPRHYKPPPFPAKAFKKIACMQISLDALTRHALAEMVANWKGMKLNKFILLFDWLTASVPATVA